MAKKTRVPDVGARPSMWLHGAATGGIVDNTSIALRLGQLILEGLVGRAELSIQLPLRVEDRGEYWSITGSDGADSHADRVDIRKFDAAILATGLQNPPDALISAAIAEKFAAALVENGRSKEELRRQLPLTVADKGDRWLVRGSGNADRAVEGPGPFHLEVQKRDAQVLDMAFEWVLHTPPEIQELLRANARKSRHES